MRAHISKTLESIIARVAFDCSRAGLRSVLRDRLMLVILRDEASLAWQILCSLRKPWEAEQMRDRLEELIQGMRAEESDPTAEQFFSQYRAELCDVFAPIRSISTAHVLLHVTAEEQSLTSQVLALYGLTVQDILAEIKRYATPAPAPKRAPKVSDQPTSEDDLVHKFCTDLTAEAAAGRIDPVVGRQAEIARVVQILSRRKKNNPILVGEAGVGKTAVVEGLALLMVSDEVPEPLKGKKLWSLDMAALVAGTKFRGEFEERIRKFIDQLRAERNSVLFIDEIHTIAGAGATQGSLDTANILKPALARGELQLIGATTLDEFRTQIEADAALERRFQKVMVEPPTSEQTLQILKQIAPLYEKHHSVRYSDEALETCVTLAERYITDRYFPDKAIDILDEAGAQGRGGEIEAASVREVVTSMTGIPADRLQEGDAARLLGLQTYLADRVVGQTEAVARVSKAIRRARTGLRDAARPMGVFLFIGPTGVGKTLLAKELAKWMFDRKKGLVRIDMSEYGEKHNVARLFGSPPGYVGYGEGGQLTEAVRRNPYAIVLLDEIEKAHPEVFNTLLQVFDEGHLTDGSGRRVDFRNTVIIMTSNVGSMPASARMAPVGYGTVSNATAASEADAEHYTRALEQTFAPEFLNRVDDVVAFRTLELPDVEQIVDLELHGLLERVEALGYRVSVSEEARRELARRGFDAAFGVRALRRTLVEQVEDPISSLILEGNLAAGDELLVSFSEDEGVRVAAAVAA